jgi:hypothetical protein
MEQLYLSRRNLLTLLAKLDRAKAGEETECTILKSDTAHPEYPSTTPTLITAVEDEDYYAEREAGEIHPADLKLMELKKNPPFDKPSR